MLKRLSAIVAMSVLLPAVAGAWTLTVKVTGGSVGGSYATVTYGTTTRQYTGGTNYLYPTVSATTTITTAPGYAAAVKVDGFASNTSPKTFSSGSHTIEVTYAAPPPNSVRIDQTAGGSISILLPNNTYSLTGATNVAVGTVLPVTITAASSYRIVDYTINGGTNTAGVSGLPGQSLSLPSYGVTATPVPNTISATFALVPTVSATLSSPQYGYTNQSITCTAVASSNDTGLQYRFSVTGRPSGSAAKLITK